jgi:CHAD domain-containing protein
MAEAARKLIEPVIALQDHLGALNDTDVAAERARDFLESEALALRPEHRRAIESFVVAREQEVRMLAEATPRAWRNIGEVDFRHRLAGALADL